MSKFPIQEHVSVSLITENFEYAALRIRESLNLREDLSRV